MNNIAFPKTHGFRGGSGDDFPYEGGFIRSHPEPGMPAIIQYLGSNIRKIPDRYTVLSLPFEHYGMGLDFAPKNGLNGQVCHIADSPAVYTQDAIANLPPHRIRGLIQRFSGSLVDQEKGRLEYRSVLLNIAHPRLHFPFRNHASDQTDDCIEENGKHEVHEGPGKQHAHPLQYRLISEPAVFRDVAVLLFTLFIAKGYIFLPGHHHKAAYGKGADTVVRFAPLNPKQPRRHTHAEPLHIDTESLCRQEVPQFMKEDEQAQHRQEDDNVENHSQLFHCFGQRQSIRACPRIRFQNGLQKVFFRPAAVIHRTRNEIRDTHKG